MSRRAVSAVMAAPLFGGLVMRNSAPGRMRRRLAFALAATMLAAGCRSAPPPAPPKDPAAIIRLSASDDVNPNSEGRPSPVHLRLFQFKDPSLFMAADFFSLTDKEQATLGDSVVQRLEQDLIPGEVRALALKIAPETRALGVMVEFANYRNAEWRVVAPAPTAKQRRDQVLYITIEKDKATIALGD